MDLLHPLCPEVSSCPYAPRRGTAEHLGQHGGGDYALVDDERDHRRLKRLYGNAPGPASRNAARR